MRYTTYNTLSVGVTTLIVTRCIPYPTLTTGITYRTPTIGNIDPTIGCITYSTLTITTTNRGP